MTSVDLANLAARPEIHVGCGTRPACALVPRYFRRFTLRDITMNILNESLYHPPVVRGKKQVFDVSWTLHAHFFEQIPLHDVRKLRKQNVRWNCAMRLRLVIARQRSRQIKREFLQTPFRPEFLQTDLIELSRSTQRRTPAIVHVQSLDFHFRRNSSRLQSQRRDSAP